MRGWRSLSRMQRLPHAQLIGVDISSNMIDLSRKNLLRDSRLHLFVNSGADLSMIASESVDFCYANDVFIHIADVNVVVSYFEEVARILKQGGLFRFNVRELDINGMFSNSDRVRIAKASYLLGLRSGIHQYSAGNEGFSGSYVSPSRACWRSASGRSNCTSALNGSRPERRRVFVVRLLQALV